MGFEGLRAGLSLNEARQKRRFDEQIAAQQLQSSQEAQRIKIQNEYGKQAAASLASFESGLVEQYQATLARTKDRAAADAELDTMISNLRDQYIRPAAQTFPNHIDPFAFEQRVRLAVRKSLTPAERGRVAGETQGATSAAAAAVPGSTENIQQAEIVANQRRADQRLGLDFAANARAERKAQLEEVQTLWQMRQPNSVVGKKLGDYINFADTFGEDHPVTSAMREVALASADPDPASFSDVAGLRKEYTKASADTAAMAGHYRRIKAAAAAPSPAAGLALIFSFMKMLDPASTVREGEAASVQNAAGVPTRVRNVYNNLLSGERLSPQQYEDFGGQAETQFKAQLEGQSAIDKEFRRISEQQGIAPENVVWDVSLGGIDASPDVSQKDKTIEDKGANPGRRKLGSAP